jgi:hypothetical protein
VEATVAQQVWRDGFRRSDLIPRHTDRCIMASHHCQKNCHPRTKGGGELVECLPGRITLALVKRMTADINCLASLGSDSSEAHSGLRRYVQDYSISGSGGAASPKLTRRRQKLNATWKSLSIPRPGMQDEICVAGYMHDSLMITKAKVTTNDVLTRPLNPASFFHNSTPTAGLP